MPLSLYSSADRSRFFKSFATFSSGSLSVLSYFVRLWSEYLDEQRRVRAFFSFCALDTSTHTQESERECAKQGEGISTRRFLAEAARCEVVRVETCFTPPKCLAHVLRTEHALWWALSSSRKIYRVTSQ